MRIWHAGWSGKWTIRQTTRLKARTVSTIRTACVLQFRQGREGFKTAILPVVKGEIVRGGLQEHQKPRTDGISPSVTAACGMGGGQTPIFTERRGTLYRIRKLTPRECGRLMGVDDSDIDKMETVNSNSQLYRQFGDSIVVDVMCAMFRNLNIKGVRKDG